MSMRVRSFDLPANAAERVICSLKEGLQSINSVYEALINGDVDPFSGQCRHFIFIRHQIVQAKHSLERSDHAASAGLRSLDQSIELLTRDEGNLERDVRSKQQTLKNLRTTQTSNETLLRQSRDALEVARSNLRSARDTLERQKDRQNTAAVVTGVGVGLFIIPVAGWIAGTALVVGGLKELDEAADAIKEAKEEEEESESDVDRYSNKVSHYKSEISQTERNISQKKHQIEQVHTDIQKVKQQRAAVADLQGKVRRAVHILGVLSGRISVVERQTRRFIVLEPVMRVMEDVMKAAGAITGSQLLFRGGIPRLLDLLKENNRRLTAICYSTKMLKIY